MRDHMRGVRGGGGDSPYPWPYQGIWGHGKVINLLKIEIIANKHD